jgi:hypothetical protein
VLRLIPTCMLSQNQSYWYNDTRVCIKVKSRLILSFVNSCGKFRVKADHESGLILIRAPNRDQPRNDTVWNVIDFELVASHIPTRSQSAVDTSNVRIGPVTKLIQCEIEIERQSLAHLRSSRGMIASRNRRTSHPVSASIHTQSYIVTIKIINTHSILALP